MNRGGRREPISPDDQDRLLLLETPRGQDFLGCSRHDLQGRRKSDPQKIRSAARLRRETTMTLEWIADRILHEGSDARRWPAAAPPPQRGNQ